MGNANIGRLLQLRDEHQGTMADQATHDEREDAADTHRGPVVEATLDSSDPMLAVAPGRERGAFEHRRVVDSARSALFGRPTQLHIGRYRVLRQIGVGGMGEVYLARDEDLGREVAVKRVIGDATKPKAQARLRREARALARLDHPNVVQVYEVGEHEQRTFLAMQYVDGEDLGSWLASGERPWRAILDRFLAAGRGLAAAHAAGLVHRDFKPENVLLSQSGEVRVADFGLVLATEQAAAPQDLAPASALPLPPMARLSVTGSILGTIRYMPLEQIRGLEVDARSDQFSFCIALYEALYQRLPFSLESSAGRLAALTDDEPLPPPAGGFQAPPAALWRVIRRGLSREADARWADMDALLVALERGAKQRRRLAGIGAGVLALGLSVAALVAFGQQPEPDPCAQIERELEGSWDDTRRSTLSDTLGALEVGHGGDSLARVLSGLDRWSAGWTEARKQVCEAQSLQAIEPELGRLQNACLTRQRQRVEDLVELLSAPEADGTTLARAVEAVAELPPAAACGEELALLGVEPAPEGQREAVEEIRRELERAHQLRLLGELDEALELARTNEAKARELGYGPLEAEGLAELAKAELAAGFIEQGVARVEDAVDAAELHRHEHLAAELWTVLTLRTLNDFGDPLVGKLRLRRAKIANERIGNSARVNARLEFGQALIAGFNGDWVVAEAGLRTAIALTQDDQSAKLDRPSYLTHLATIVARNDAKAAVALLEESASLTEEVYGSNHPQTARALYKLATFMQGSQGRSSSFDSLFARAQEIGFEGVGGSQRAEVEHALGTMALRNLDLEAAEAHARKAAELQQHTLPGEHITRASTEHLLATIYALRQEHEQALVHFRNSVGILQRQFPPDHPQLLRAQGDTVAELLALGRLDEAERELARFKHAIAGGDPHVPFEIYRAELALRQGDPDTALGILSGIATAPLGEHKHSYQLLRGIAEVRTGTVSEDSLLRLRAAELATHFSPSQIDEWLDQLRVSAAERQALGLE